jgi:hypothetical protein
MIAELYVKTSERVIKKTDRRYEKSCMIAWFNNVQENRSRQIRALNYGSRRSLRRRVVRSKIFGIKRIVLRRSILRPDSSSPENSSLDTFLAQNG